MVTLALCVLALPPLASAGTLIDDRDKAVTILREHEVNDIVFAVRGVAGDGHWYANFSYNVQSPSTKLYRDGGRLARLNVETGEVTTLLYDKKGGVRDPQMHYDGK